MPQSQQRYGEDIGKDFTLSRLQYFAISLWIIQSNSSIRLLNNILTQIMKINRKLIRPQRGSYMSVVFYRYEETLHNKPEGKN